MALLHRAIERFARKPVRPLAQVGDLREDRRGRGVDHRRALDPVLLDRGGGLGDFLQLAQALVEIGCDRLRFQHLAQAAAVVLVARDPRHPGCFTLRDEAELEVRRAAARLLDLGADADLAGARGDDRHPAHADRGASRPGIVRARARIRTAVDPLQGRVRPFPRGPARPQLEAREKGLDRLRRGHDRRGTLQPVGLRLLTEDRSYRDGGEDDDACCQDDLLPHGNHLLANWKPKRSGRRAGRPPTAGTSTASYRHWRTVIPVAGLVPPMLDLTMIGFAGAIAGSGPPTTVIV